MGSLQAAFDDASFALDLLESTEVSGEGAGGGTAVGRHRKLGWFGLLLGSSCLPYTP